MARRRRKRTTAAKTGGANIQRLERELAALTERVDVLFAAVGLQEAAKRGDRGTVGDVSGAVLKIQDHLLRTSERLDKILGALKNHRELLVKMNQRIFQVDARDRIRLELDLMKNTASVLALNGVELDEGVLAELQRLGESADKGDVDVVSLRKEKEKLDKRFAGEVKKVDLTAIYRPRGKRGIPGYR